MSNIIEGLAHVGVGLGVAGAGLVAFLPAISPVVAPLALIGGAIFVLMGTKRLIGVGI